VLPREIIIYVNTALEKGPSTRQRIRMDVCLCLSVTCFGNGKDETLKKRERDREGEREIERRRDIGRDRG
jgi:hypothetical protein